MKQGEFELALGENALKLRCTPAALRAIETNHGGIRAVIQKVFNVEFSTIQSIVEAGLIGGPAYDKATLEQEIFDAGIVDLSIPIVEYITLLGAGGKPSVEEEPAKGEA